jgi:Ca2+-binding EF-hand superfamily protein
MKTPNANQTLKLLLASALATAGVIACEHSLEGNPDQIAQGVTEANAANSAQPDARRGPHGAKDGWKRGPRRSGFGPGHRGPKDPSWLFKRFDEDQDGQVALADLPELKREWLSKADANGDGSLTPDEMQAHHEQRRAQFMKDIDTNGDGEISDAEQIAFRTKMQEKRFAESDENGDGLLTENEVHEFRWSHLIQADANEDGKLTLDEIKTAVENGTLKPPPHRGPGKGRRGGGPRGPRGVGPAGK